MDRRQLLVVVVTVLAIFAALFLTAYMGGGGTVKRSGGLKFRQGPRKEKTFVDNDLYDKIAGSETVAGRDAPRNKPQDTGKTVAGKSAEPSPTPELAGAAEALNALTPEDGITRLAALLAKLDNLEQASRLYSSLGTLYAQTGDAGTAPAEEAFAAAKKSARSHEDRHAAALAHVAALSARGDIEGALREAAAGVQEGDPLTFSGMQLAVAQGKLHERQNAPDLAEAAYNKAMRDALAAEAVLGENALNVYRQSCLSLTQLYRRTGRESAANSLVTKMKNEIARHASARN